MVNTLQRLILVDEGSKGQLSDIVEKITIRQVHHRAMTIGIRHFRAAKQVVWISGLLSMPFRGKVSGYVINRRQWEDTDQP